MKELIGKIIEVKQENQDWLDYQSRLQRWDEQDTFKRYPSLRPTPNRYAFPIKKSNKGTAKPKAVSKS